MRTDRLRFRRVEPATKGDLAALTDEELLALRGLLAKYSPDQPRDERGRFAGSSGEEVTLARDTYQRVGSFTSDHLGRWARGLTAGQTEAVAAYISFKYQVMNALLRGQPVPDHYTVFGTRGGAVKQADVQAAERYNAELRAAIDRAPPLRDPLVVYREFDSRQFGSVHPGDIVTDKGFVSVALRPDDTHIPGAYPLDPVTHQSFIGEVAIHLPAGTQVGGATEQPHEFILQAGSSFRVNDVIGPDANGTTKFDMTYIGLAASKGARAQGAGYGSRFFWGAGDVTVTRGTATKYSEDEPRDERGRWEGGGTIDHVVSVTDTRVLDDSQDPPVRIPGSGTQHECDRCGSNHEIHVTAQLTDGRLVNIGSSCATRDEMSIVRPVLNAAKNIDRYQGELTRAQTRIDTVERETTRVAGLTPPPVVETTVLGGRGFAMGDVRVKQLEDGPITGERLASLDRSWREARVAEATGLRSSQIYGLYQDRERAQAGLGRAQAAYAKATGTKKSAESYNPDEPRDEGGRWTADGGEAAGEKATFSSAKEAGDWLSSRWPLLESQGGGNLKVDLGNADPRVATEVVRTLDGLRQRYPGLASELTEITTKSVSEMHSADGWMLFGHMMLSRDTLEHPDFFRARLERDVRDGYMHPAALNGLGYEYLVTHEFGHLWAGNQGTRAFWEKQQEAEFQAAKDGESKPISGYSMRQPWEWSAEAFAICRLSTPEQLPVELQPYRDWFDAKDGKPWDEWVDPATGKPFSAKAAGPGYCPMMTELDRQVREDVERGSTALKYSEDEPRDERGRWSDGGGDGAPEWKDPGGDRPKLGVPGDDLTHEQMLAYYDERHAADAEWRAAMNRGVALGRISAADAEARGWDEMHGHGGRDVQPLPDTLYHATVALDAVMRDGLKTPDELHGRSVGLGGGDSGAISFTSNRDYADRIAETIIESHDVAVGKITLDDLIGRATEGGFAGRLRDFYETSAGKGAYDRAVAGETRLDSFDMSKGFPGMVATEQQMKDAFGDLGWKPDLTSGHFANAAGVEQYAGWLRPSTEDEAQHDRFKLYNAFLWAQGEAGGPDNPLFWNTDPKYYASVDPAQVGVVEAHPIPGAMGYYQSDAEWEWRTWTGDAVTVAATKVAGSTLWTKTEFFTDETGVHPIRGSEGYEPEAAGEKPAEGKTDIRTVEKAIFGLKDHEELRALDDKGRVVFSKRGRDGESWVDLTPEDDAKMAGAIMTHNHPGGSSLSHFDLMTASRDNLVAIRAVGTNLEGQSFIYEARRVGDHWPSDQVIRFAADEASTMVRSWLTPAVDEAIRKGPDEAQAAINYAMDTHQHLVVQALADKLGFEYTRTPWDN